MKYLFIYRGDNMRPEQPGRTYIDLLMNWDNHQKVFYEDCIKNGHTYDIAFVTYNTSVLKDIIDKVNPKILMLNPKINQIENFKDVIELMLEKQNKYDRFVVIRSDFSYKLPLSKWPKIEQRGIFFINKDAHWINHHFYSEILFIFDNLFIDIVDTCFKKMAKTGLFTGGLHGFCKAVYENHDIICICDEYYHILDHPIHQFSSIEGIANLVDPLPAKPIEDVSIYNPGQPNPRYINWDNY